MSMKKIISLILSVMMLLTGIPVTAMETTSVQDEIPTICISSTDGRTGGIASVDISLKNNPGVAIMIFDVQYDSTALSVENVVFNKDFGGETGVSSITQNPLTISYDNTENQSEDIVFATINFRVKANAKVGSSAKISINYDDNNIIDIDENAVDFEIEDGIVSILNGVPGDINSDESVNGIDLLRMRKYFVKYDVEYDPIAMDVTGDKATNALDLLRFRKYFVNKDTEIFYGTKSSKLVVHEVEKIAATEPTCTEEGNIEYWYCSDCGKYFEDEELTKEIAFEDTIINSQGHTEVDMPTDLGVGGKQCSACGEILVEPTPVVEEAYSITYDITYNNAYLKTTDIIKANPNQTFYKTKEGYTLLDMDTDSFGFEFKGWFTGMNGTGEQVQTIPAGSVGNIRVYAYLEECEYSITYVNYKTPVGAVVEEDYLKYKVSEGQLNLPNPEVNNYLFLGWYNNDGKEVTSIPVGTVGNITLNAYWTSLRNLARQKKTLDKPIVLENTGDGIIYFVYELGTIENIPLSDDPIWEIQSVAGLSQQKSVTATRTTTSEYAKEISESISNATVDSGTWSLSEEWNNVTSLNSEWAEENRTDEEYTEEKAKTTAGTYSLVEYDDRNYATTKTDGTTTLKYDSVKDTRGNSQELDVHVGGSYSNEGNLLSKVAGTAKFEASLDGKFNWNHNKEKHTGTDTTTVDTLVVDNDHSWGSSETTEDYESESELVASRNATSEVISEMLGYGKSFAYGGSGSTSGAYSNTTSSVTNSSSTLNYSTAEVTTTTSTYSTDGKLEGKYRMVVAGTAHVFGVVGYNIATNQFFTHTYSVMDDKEYEFLDYTPKGYDFDDYENSVLTFEIPYFSLEYVNENVAITKGLAFSTDSNTKTAKVTKYEGTDTDIIIPSYISSGNTAYKVTEIAPSAFAGKNIRAVSLSKFIEKIPDGAFQGCTNLKQISGYFNIIGNNAFNGCTQLENFSISTNVTEIGTDAFVGVPSINVKACDQEVAVQAVASGAKNITLDISNLTATATIELSVPANSKFTLQGGKKTFSNFKLESLAEETVIEEISIKNTLEIPLIISSSDVTFEAVSVESQGYSLILKADGTTINLIRDTNITSAGENAIISKDDLTFTSVLLSNVYGSLTVVGNVNVCGTASGVDNIDVTNGKINEGCSWSAPTKPVLTIDKTTCYDRDVLTCTWTETENSDYYNFFVVDKTTRERVFGQWNLTDTEIVFDAPSAGAYVVYVYAINKILVDTGEKYYTSSDETTLTVSPSDYTITFNGNGGTPSKSSQSVTYNSTYGTLPTATKDYYNFLGWYTAASGGTQVTSSTKFTSTSNVTLYAHWELKPVSTKWVLKSEMPAGAQAVNTKYTYAKTHYTTSSSSTMSGWTKYDTTWVWSNYGSWSAWQYGAVTETDSRDVETQQVVDVPAHTEYRYGAYVRYNNDLKHRACLYNAGYGLDGSSNGPVKEIWTDWSDEKLPCIKYAIKCYHTTNSGYCTHRPYESYGEWGDFGLGYALYYHMYGETGIYDTDNHNAYYWEQTRNVATTYKTQYRYRDRSKIYTYHFYKVENLESTTYPTGDNISTINEWVQYREK